MNTLVSTVLDNLEKQLAGYQYLLTYRYQNLCVKAEPAALLPVTININGEEQDIEQVADVATPDDYHFQILPKMTNSLEEINIGILNAHPEFKPSFEQIDSENPDTQYLVYEMPKVDKERHDFLMEATKGLHDECKARMEALCGSQIDDFTELFVSNPESLKEATDAIKDLRNEYLDNIDDVMEKKQDEIEEAYARYLVEEEEAHAAEDDNFDFSKGMRQESLE